MRLKTGRKNQMRDDPIRREEKEKEEGNNDDDDGPASYGTCSER